MTAPTSSTLNLIYFRFAIYKHYYEYARTISDSCCQYDKTFRSAARLVRFRMTNICLFPLSFHCRPTCTHVPARASVDVIVVARSVLLLCAGMRDIAILPQRDTCHSRICRVVKVAAIPNASHHPTKGSCPLSCIFVSIAIVACRVGVACFVFFFFALKQKPNHKHYCSMNTDNFPFHLFIYTYTYICIAYVLLG